MFSADKPRLDGDIESVKPIWARKKLKRLEAALAQMAKSLHAFGNFNSDVLADLQDGNIVPVPEYAIITFRMPDGSVVRVQRHIDGVLVYAPHGKLNVQPIDTKTVIVSQTDWLEEE